MGRCGGETLVFEVDGRRFGLPASAVRELVRAVAIVPLPMAGPAVEGVVNLRGRVVPVIDLRARLGLPPRPVAPSDHLIVIQAWGVVAALRVDRALELVPFDAETCGTGIGGAQVVQLSDGLAPLLDLRDLIDGAGGAEALVAAADTANGDEGEA